jgi:hypothetical protein
VIRHGKGRLGDISLPHQRSGLETASVTAAALVAFAANSLLCRLALGDEQVDAASYASLRLLSGAVTLWVVLALAAPSRNQEVAASWVSGAMLFIYAAAFSFAYLTLDGLDRRSSRSSTHRTGRRGLAAPWQAFRALVRQTASAARMGMRRFVGRGNSHLILWRLVHAGRR